jgi:hypothetical protein
MKGVVLAATAAALAVSGSAAASTGAAPIRIVFGFYGGMLGPEQVTIEPTGRVLWHGGFTQPPGLTQLSHAKLVSLSRSVRAEFAAGLKSRQCHGNPQLPDLPTDFIRATGRTVRVHGRCDARFNRLWNALAQAVGLGYR